jgi:photosystem II stability/assembly factor-like uncharacterized protein
MKTMKASVSALLVLCAVLLSLGVSAVRAQADGPVSDDIPRITQLLTLPGGRLLVVTTEKGGLYLSGGDRGRWHKAEGIPDLYIHRATRDHEGHVCLATSDGLYSLQKGKWEKIAQGAIADLYVQDGGTELMLRYWGKGLHRLDARSMTGASLQAMQDAAARVDSLAAAEEGVRQEMQQLSRGAAASIEEKRKIQELYVRWQNLKKNKEDAIRRKEAAMPVRVMAGLPDGASVVGVIPWQGGWLAGVFGRGMYRLISGSERWQPLQDGPSAWVLTLNVSPWGQVYAGFFGAGLFVLSADTTWKRVDGVPTDCSVQDVAFGSKEQILVATREQGTLFSQDRGRTWKSGPGGNVQGVAIGSDGRLWAGLWEGGLSVSNDDGATWRPKLFAHVGHVADMAFTGDGRGFAVLAGLGLIATTDNGSSWSQVKLPVRPTRNVRLAVDRDGRLFAASPREGLHVSVDGGRSWKPDQHGLPDGGVMVVTEAPDGTMLAIPGDGSGLFRRDDSGSWHLVPLVGEEGWDYGVWDLQCLPGNRMLAFGPMDLILSEDGGRTWRRHRFGQALRDVVAVDASGTLYTRRMISTFSLRPGEVEWESVPAIPEKAFRLLRDVGGGRRIGVPPSGGLDVLEVRGGSVVRVAGHAIGSGVTSLAVGAGGAVFVGLETGMIVSRDGGRTWRQCNLVEY